MYISLAEVRQRLAEDEIIRLTDDLDSGVVNEATVDAAIVAAGLEIDAYLGERYTLPLALVPGIVQHLACDITVYNLYARNPDGPTEHWQRRYSNAGKLLRQLAAGTLTLGAGTEQAPNGTSSGPARVFDRATLRGF